MYGIYGMYWVLPVLSTWQDNHNRWRWRASPRQQTCPLRQRCVALVPGDQRAPPDGSLGSGESQQPWRRLVCFFLRGKDTSGGWSTWKMGGTPKFHLVYLGFLVYSIYVYLGEWLMDIYHLLDGMILQVHPPARESNYLPETKIGRAAKGTYRNLVFPPSIFRCELLSPKSLSNWEFLRFSAHQQEAPTDFCAKNSCFQQIQAQEVIQRWCFSIPQSTAHQLWYLVYPPTIYMEFDTSQLS